MLALSEFHCFSSTAQHQALAMGAYGTGDSTCLACEFACRSIKTSCVSNLPAHDAFVIGKPAARQGRKASGLGRWSLQIAGLPIE